MKCLSLHQPWASLIVRGAKRYDTRRWSTTYRGRLGIHAARHWCAEMDELCQREPIRSLLRAAGYASAADLPHGALLGTVELVDCFPVSSSRLEQVPAAERDLGEYGPGRLVWQFAAALPLAEPVPCVGRLGLFDRAEPTT
jgi:hypothetical protein